MVGRFGVVAVSFLDLLFLPTLQYPPFYRIPQKSSLYIFTEQNTKANRDEKLERKGFPFNVDFSFNGFSTWVAEWILVESSEPPRFASTEGPVNRGMKIL